MPHIYTVDEIAKELGYYIYETHYSFVTLRWIYGSYPDMEALRQLVKEATGLRLQPALFSFDHRAYALCLNSFQC